MSKKNEKRLIRVKGRTIPIPSKAYMAFEKDALYQLLSYREKYTGPVSVSFIFEMKGKMSSDLDNMISSLCDVLQKAGIIDDDKNVVCINAVKYNGFKDFQTHISINPIANE